MVISNAFHGFWHYNSNAIFNKAKKLLEELNDYLADRVYTTDLQLDIIRFTSVLNVLKIILRNYLNS